MAKTCHSGWVTNWYSLPENEHLFRLYPGEQQPWTHKGRTYRIPRWEYIGYRRDDKYGYINLDAQPAGSVLKTHKDLGLKPATPAIYKDATERLTSIAKYGEAVASMPQWVTYIADETKLRDDAVDAINNALHADSMKAWERRRHALAIWRL